MQVKLAPTLINILKESFPVLGESFPQNVSEAVISENGLAFGIKNSSIFVSCKFDFNVLISNGAKKAETATSSHETNQKSEESSTKSKKSKRDNNPLSFRWYTMMKLAEENGEWYKCLKDLLDDGHILTRTRSVIHKDGTPIPAWYFVLLPKKIEKKNKKGEDNYLPSNVKNFYTTDDEKYYLLKESVVELTFKSVKEHFDATNNLLSEGLMKRANCTLPLTSDEIAEIEAKKAEKKAKKEQKVKEPISEPAQTEFVEGVTSEPTSEPAPVEPETTQEPSPEPEPAPVQESTQEAEPAPEVAESTDAPETSEKCEESSQSSSEE